MDAYDDDTLCREIEYISVTKTEKPANRENLINVEKKTQRGEDHDVSKKKREKKKDKLLTESTIIEFNSKIGLDMRSRIY